MFALRDKNTTQSVNALSLSFNDPSALFRHEVAFVFGQMRNEVSIDCLVKVLKNDKEPMVRHEAAEALGSIATDYCKLVLEEFKADDDTVVRESCEVGVDMIEYENGNQMAFLNVDGGDRQLEK